MICALTVLAGLIAPFVSGSANVNEETGVTYRIRPSEDLKSVLVQAEFPDNVEVLEARDGDARRLEELKGCNEQEVRFRSDRILTKTVDGCLRYRYPLIPSTGRRSPAVARGVVVTAPSQWLWTPPAVDGTPIRIELSLPSAMEASVPWRRVGPNTFELSRSPGSSTGSAVFGPIDVVDLEIDNARLRVAMIDGPGNPLDRQKILDWLTVAGRDVAGVTGAFPNPDVQVIVQPVSGGRSRSPVPFGYVIRDGGEAVRFFVDPERPLQAYLDDWTATHEFSHLLLPYVRSREKWVSEGFASYYQNVLLARRGAYSESEAWSRLHRSFERARQIKNPPRLEDIDDRPFWEVRMLIYWSGAAMALAADARLRELSGGEESLDTVLARLRECCLPSGKVWRAAELFEQLDALSPYPVFVNLHREFNRTPGMPDLSSLYADLGLEVDGDGIEIDGNGRLVNVRRAIMGQ